MLGIQVAVSTVDALSTVLLAYIFTRQWRGLANWRWLMIYLGYSKGKHILETGDPLLKAIILKRLLWPYT